MQSSEEKGEGGESVGMGSWEERWAKSTWPAAASQHGPRSEGWSLATPPLKGRSVEDGRAKPHAVGLK